MLARWLDAWGVKLIEASAESSGSKAGSADDIKNLIDPETSLLTFLNPVDCLRYASEIFNQYCAE